MSSTRRLRKPANSFKCTFTACTATFDSETALRSHKINSPDHDFCTVCNLDFASDNAFLIHKLQSNRHITCPVCGQDFHSQGGQRLHLEQMHAAKQDITCVGCGDLFSRAGGLMAHIEQNACPKITLEKFQSRRAQKEMVKAFLADPEGFSLPNSPLTKVLDPREEKPREEVKSDIGAKSLLDDDIPGPVVGPILAPEASPKPTSDWPKLELAAYKDGPLDDLLTGWESDIKEPSTTWGQQSSTLLFPHALKSPLPAQDVTGGAAKTEKRVAAEAEEEITDPWHPKSKCFRPEQYIHPVTGKFMCPYPTCTASAKTRHAFEQHLLSPAHLPENHPCPCCLKIFKSTAALVQHCESSSSRCQIRKADDYNIVLDTITGGYIETKGHHADGTIKYNAAEPQW